MRGFATAFSWLSAAACSQAIDTADVLPPCAGNEDCATGWYCIDAVCLRLAEPLLCVGGQLPGETQVADCGLCGVQARTCGIDGHYGPWSECNESAVCSPGAVETRPGGNGAQASRTCRSTCRWSSWRCTPGCEAQGRVCGDDGCGGTCGRVACDPPYACSPEGRCVAGEP